MLNDNDDFFTSWLTISLFSTSLVISLWNNLFVRPWFNERVILKLSFWIQLGVLLSKDRVDLVLLVLTLAMFNPSLISEPYRVFTDTNHDPFYFGRNRILIISESAWSRLSYIGPNPTDSFFYVNSFQQMINQCLFLVFFSLKHYSLILFPFSCITASLLSFAD